MTITFHGAARSVTGSRHELQLGNTRILLDCGLFQGRRQDSERFNRYLGVDPETIHAVLLSHAHIDHSGALPILAKGKFRGSVYMTGATKDLVEILLEDSARIQQADCQYLNKKARPRGQKKPTPYYSIKDVHAIRQQFETVPYDQMFQVSSRIKARFTDAGHILGSSSVWVKYTSQGQSVSVLFSGDVGRYDMPILRDPQPSPPCDVLILESTYGDRMHDEDLEAMRTKAESLVKHALKHKSKIIVPAFAVGRTQELVMRIKELVQDKRIPPIPIYIDSPLASKATQVFRRHPECFDEETLKTFTSEKDLFGAKYIHYVGSVQESQRLNDRPGPCVIIAASGMCEGGRIIHHLKHGIQNEANIIAMVGFQAEHTLGRKLIEEWDTVPIFGKPTPRRAQIVRFNGLSAHGDRHDLLEYVHRLDPKPRKIFVVHGEERQSFSLAAALREEYPKMDVIIPNIHTTYDL
jgi:metallo-beta-lactamase family protein